METNRRHNVIAKAKMHPSAGGDYRCPSVKRTVIKKEKILVSSHSRVAEQGTTSQEPQIRINRKGDWVESIILTCPCGKVSEIFLDYQD